ncbi:hypothetical protein Fmac_025666 [Flemingia macrophylla]|uniref:Uncharacterized protein n=1 Tax=Flemingia macrophylla TaxID=520843 RepID=A0ABD1LSV0_9FABA
MTREFYCFRNEICLSSRCASALHPRDPTVVSSTAQPPPPSSIATAPSLYGHCAQLRRCRASALHPTHPTLVSSTAQPRPPSHHRLAKIRMESETHEQNVIFTNESNIERWKKKRQAAVDSKIGRLNNVIQQSSWFFRKGVFGYSSLFTYYVIGRDYDPTIRYNDLLDRVLRHRDAIVSHLNWTPFHEKFLRRENVTLASSSST